MKLIFFAMIVLVASLIGMLIFEKDPEKPDLQLNQSSAAKVATRTIPNDLYQKFPIKPTHWEGQFKALSKRIGGLTRDPAAMDNEITNFAKALKQEQIKLLYQIVISTYQTGDEKLTATELLVRSNHPTTISLLTGIINADPAKISSALPIQQEYKAFQMLAIEGLATKAKAAPEAKRALNELVSKTTDSQLLDRIHRGLWALDGRAPSPEEQDMAALKELL
jgi:hypothetical protein